MARVLVVDDEARFRQLYQQVLEDAGTNASAAASAEEALAIIEAGGIDMVVSDVRMPGADGIDLLRRSRASQPEIPFLLVTAYADIRDAVAALKLGAVDYLAKPVDLDELVAAVRDALHLTPEPSPGDVPAEAVADLVLESPSMKALVADAWRIADSDATVLLMGESGVGKEVLARLIHRGSPRSKGPLVAVNCGAIPANLLASELFGHERGAFTGADAARPGRFREADRGTLFLDEIGELPLELQPVLLRVLETQQVRPVGGSRDVSVDYRLVAATNRALEDAVADGTFRQDLYYRLAVVGLSIPPLRERPEDVLPLARRFLSSHDGGAGRTGSRRLSPEAGRLLERHRWPGNVRELANAMERAALLCRGDVILPEHLPPALRSSGSSAEPRETLRDQEIAHIQSVLEQTGGNRTHAAEILGITRRGLIYKLKRFGIR